VSGDTVVLSIIDLVSYLSARCCLFVKKPTYFDVPPTAISVPLCITKTNTAPTVAMDFDPTNFESFSLSISNSQDIGNGWIIFVPNMCEKTSLCFLELVEFSSGMRCLWSSK